MADFLLNLIKFFLAILLLPFVYAAGVTFYLHFDSYSVNYQDFFLSGVGAFLLTFLFIYQFWGVYEFGQKIMMALFTFISPLNKLVAYFFPIYFLVIFFLLFITNMFFKTSNYDHYYIFFAGFAWAMHTLLSAQELQEEEKSPLKPTYLLTICFVIVINCLVAILLFDVFFGEWTIMEAINDIWTMAKDVYIAGYERVTAVEWKLPGKS